MPCVCPYVYALETVPISLLSIPIYTNAFLSWQPLLAASPASLSCQPLLPASWQLLAALGTMLLAIAGR